MPDQDTLRTEIANALHKDWCGCDSWDGTNCEDYYEREFPEQADAVMPVLARAGLLRAAESPTGTDDVIERALEPLHVVMCPCGWELAECRRELDPDELRDIARAVLAATLATPTIEEPHND